MYFSKEYENISKETLEIKIKFSKYLFRFLAVAIIAFIPVTIFCSMYCLNALPITAINLLAEIFLVANAITCVIELEKYKYMLYAIEEKEEKNN